jgi:hypothetical protein
MKNYDMVLSKVSSWLKPDGRRMVQILGNRRFAYDFKTTDWMGKYFFAGGTMPSRDLFEYFLPADLTQSRVWDVDGRQYSKTLDAWLQRLDANKGECLQALEGGPDAGSSSDEDEAGGGRPKPGSYAAEQMELKEALKSALHALYVEDLRRHGAAHSADDIARLLSIDIELNAQGIAVWLEKSA